MLDFKIEGDTVVIEAPEKLKAKDLRSMAAWMNRHGIAAYTQWRPEYRFEGRILDRRAFVLVYEGSHYGYSSLDEDGWDGDEGHRWDAANFRDCLMIAGFDVVLWSYPGRGEGVGHHAYRAEIVHDHDDQCDVLASCSSYDDTIAFAGLILWAHEADKIRDARKVIDADDLSKQRLPVQLHECFLKARAA